MPSSPIAAASSSAAASGGAVPLRAVRDVGEVLNATFSFIRLHARALGQALLFIAGPLLIVSLLGFGKVQQDYFTFFSVMENGGALPEAEAPGVPVPALAILGVSLVLSTLGGALAVTAVLAVVRLHDERGGAASIEVGEVWAVVKPRYGRMLLTTLGFSLAVALPVVIVLIPCLGALAYVAYLAYALPVFSLAYPMRMERGDLGFWAALGRCRNLARGAFWQTFGVVALAYLIYSVINATFSIPATALSVLQGLHSLEGNGGSVLYDAAFFATHLLSGAASTVVYCVPVIAIALQYYNLVERSDYAGLMRRVEALGDDAGPAGGPGAPADALRSPRTRDGTPDDARGNAGPGDFAEDEVEGVDDVAGDPDAAAAPDDFADRWRDAAGPGDAGQSDAGQGDDAARDDDGAGRSRWARR